METTLALQAQGVYLDKRCDNCHVLDGRGGKMGPSLHGIGARREASWIRAYIANPQGVSRQSSMPRVEMTQAELDLITQYLKAHQ